MLIWNSCSRTVVKQKRREKKSDFLYQISPKKIFLLYVVGARRDSSRTEESRTVFYTVEIVEHKKHSVARSFGSTCVLLPLACLEVF
jgi:hypothetical protein